MKKISVIGGINVDITGNPYGQIEHGKDNPGDIGMKLSGSGRDISENLARLGVDVSFIAKTGDDFPGNFAKEQLGKLGVDVEHVCLDEDGNTPMILEIYNIMNDLEMSFGNSDVLEQLDKPLLEKAMNTLKKSEMVCMDTGMTKENLEWLTGELKDVPMFLDPGTAATAQKAKELLPRFHTIAPNRLEAEKLSGLEILSEEEVLAAGEYFVEQGVKRVFIKMAGGGVFYAEGANRGIIKPGEVAFVNGHGAGDAFSAALLDAYLKGMDVEESAKYAMAAASIAIETREAVNKKMSQKEIQRRMDR